MRNNNQIDYNSEIQDAYEKIMALEKAKVISKYSLPQNPSSDGNYHIYVKDSSKKSGRKQLKAKTLDELIDKVYQFEKGIYGNAPKTFREAFELSESEKTKYIKNEEKLLSANNTSVVKDACYRKYFAETSFENMKVEDIKKIDIEDFCYDILAENDITNKCFLSIRGIIKGTLQYSYNQYWIIDNPYLRIDFSKYKDMLKVPTDISERVHTDEEIEKFFDFLHEKQRQKPSYVPAYALELQMIMGLRSGEVPPLRWKDVTKRSIRISREQILVRKSKTVEHSYSKIVEHTKTYVSRDFPVTGEIEEFLARLKKMLDKYYPDTEYLFPDPTKQEGVITNNIMHQLYRRMCHHLGVELSRDCMKGTHSFRRNLITKVTNSNGGDFIMASQLLGNSPYVASRHYYTGINLPDAKRILEQGLVAQ